MANILVVDDEESVCRALKRTLENMKHAVRVAPTAEKGLLKLEERAADLVILDIRLPGMSGLDALREINRRFPETAVIIITAHGTMDTAMEAVQRGAFEYLTKPVDITTAREVVARALESRETSADSVDLAAFSDVARSGVLIGTTPVMAEVFKKMGAVAGSEASVLITGESGTGKELAARAIHDASARREGPFEPVNCAALPESLLESELFGFEKGAFTGATFRKTGKFERASGGTLFLDEVGEVPPGSQSKLLRTLEEHEIEHLGGEERIPVDIRIISASNVPLEKKVADGTFREDLFYRLNVVSIELPPLRDRVDDIEPLVAAFLRRLEVSGREIAVAALDVLKAYSWPGNVRELKNAVEHAVVLSRGGTIMKEHLPANVLGGEGEEGPSARIDSLVAGHLAGVENGGNAWHDLMAVWEKPLIKRVLDRFDSNQVKAAAFLGINRSTLRKKISAYGLGGCGNHQEIP